MLEASSYKYIVAVIVVSKVLFGWNSMADTALSRIGSIPIPNDLILTPNIQRGIAYPDWGYLLKLLDFAFTVQRVAAIDVRTNTRLIL